jgi:hypothetical protein
MCVGFWRVDVLAAPLVGSPKFQFHFIGLAVLAALLKFTVLGIQPSIGVAVNVSFGQIIVTNAVCFSTSEQPY